MGYNERPDFNFEQSTSQPANIGNDRFESIRASLSLPEANWSIANMKGVENYANVISDGAIVFTPLFKDFAANKNLPLDASNSKSYDLADLARWSVQESLYVSTSANPAESVETLYEKAEFAKFSGDHAAEIKHVSEAYDRIKRQENLDSPKLLEAAVRLASLKKDTSVLDELAAEQKLKFGADHQSIAKTFTAAGDLLLDKPFHFGEDVAKAINYYEQSQNIELKQEKVNYKNQDEIFEKLIRAYKDIFNKDEKTHGWAVNEKLIRDTIKQREELLAKDRPDVAESVARLRMLMADQYQRLRSDQFDQLANKELRQALAVCESYLPAGHSITSNLCAKLSGTSDPKEAIEFRTKAIEGREKELGPNDPSVGIGYGIRAEMYAAQGQIEKAKADYDKAEAILTKSLGADHKETTDLKESMSKFYVKIKDFKKAEEIQLQLLAGETAAFGKQSEEVQKRLVNLHYLYKNAGDKNKQQDIDDQLNSRPVPTGNFFSPPLHRSRLTQEDYLKGCQSNNPSEKAWSQYRLAELYANNKDAENAGKYYREALKTFAELNGDKSSMLISISTDYAQRVLIPGGKMEEAQKLYEAVKKIESLHRARKTPHM